MQAQEQKVWKVIDLINWGKEYLQNKNIDDARLNIELLLCNIIKCRRFDLYLNFDKPLSQDELGVLKALLKRRLEFEPLQYILGETEFMGLPFKVNKNVLIPRPETELLIEECLRICKNNFQDKEKIHILDIGTGSGNIAVSLAKMNEKSMLTAVDISTEAISVAKENAELNRVSDKINFKIFDILSAPDMEEQFDIVVSNPPYVQISEFENLQNEIKNHEPKIAVTDFSDGFSFYRKIALISKNYFREKGFLAFEIAFNQAKEVKEMMEKGNYKNIIIIKDYAGLDRIITGEI